MEKPLLRLTRPAVALLQGLAATYRMRVIDGEIERAVYERGEVPIFCSWHQRWFGGICAMPRRHPIAIMVSQSQDGEFISRMIAQLGWHVVRGSSSRGGSKALRELFGCLKRHYAVGHIVDGPRGPFGEIKPGLVTLAQLSGMPIVPMIISPERAWTVNSWDRFMVPKPFSGVILRFDTPLYVPRRADEGQLEALRSHIERRFQVLYAETDALWKAERRQ